MKSILIFVLTTVQALFIPDEVRYTQGAGIMAHINQKGIDYLKVAYLPWIYDQIQNSTISDFEVKDGDL